MLCCVQSCEEQGSVFSLNFLSLKRCFLTTPPMYCPPPSPLSTATMHYCPMPFPLEHLGKSEIIWFLCSFSSHLPATMSAPQSGRPPSPIFPSAAPITLAATRCFLRVDGRQKAGGSGRRNPDLGAHACQWRTSWLYQRMSPTHYYSVFTECLPLAMHCYGAEHTLVSKIPRDPVL